VSGRKQQFKLLLESIEAIIASSPNTQARLLAISRLLKNNVAHYDWVGFYLTDPEKERELVLGPYEGAHTDHTRIPFGRGICGQAAELEETFLIQDISKETNYLSCSINVKSEIVVPIFKDGKLAGELDIDSHELEPFTEEDSTFLEKVAELVAGML